MSCGCNKGNGMNAKGAAVSRNYSNSYQCMKCYAKHLSKAQVEYAEALEDRSRSLELSLCLGDLACAEDHAEALNRRDDKKAIKSIRDRLWTFAPGTLQEMQRLASEAVKMVLSEQNVKNREDTRKKALEALERARQLQRNAASDSNDLIDSNDLNDSNDLDKDASEK